MRALRAVGSAGELQLARAVSVLKGSSVEGDASSNAGHHDSSSHEPERKKRSLSGSVTSPPVKKQALSPMNEEKKADPAVLQFQNQKLSQQLDVQKERIQDLESKIEGLEKKQEDYDANLITVNRIWGQLIEDLGILAVKATAPLNGTNGLSSGTDKCLEEAGSTSSTGDVFLQRLLSACPKTEDGSEAEAEEGAKRRRQRLEKALEARSSETVKILKCVVGGIEQQRRRNDDLLGAAKCSVSDKEVLQLVEANEAALREEVEQTRSAVDELHIKHRALLSEVTLLRDLRDKHQTEIAALAEQLEDTQTELDATKRKLVALRQQHQELQQQKQPSGSSTPHRSQSRADLLANGDAGVAGHEEFQSLQAKLEEAQVLAAQRLAEIESRQREHLQLLQQFRDLEAAMRDEQRIRATRAYQALAEQLSESKADVERLRGVVDSLQRERTAAQMREKEMLFRAEAGDSARRAFGLSEMRVRDLESKLRQGADERDRLQQRVHELQAQAARRDTVEEMRLLLSTVQKEMEVLQEELRKLKALAGEIPAVRAENKSLQDVLLRKVSECEELRKKYEATVELLKQQDGEVKAMRSTELELRMFIDMYSRESLDRRDVREVKQAEVRALAHVERLKAELDEHALALRVQAANDAEAACQRRVAEAEAEITRLREQLTEAEKKLMELQESLRAKAEESDVYMTEIETISQAYEDMQAQNRRLIQRISERDEYNTQLMGESVKAKQLQSSITTEKEGMEARMAHVAAQAAIDRERATALEGQIKTGREQLERALEESRKAQSEVEVARRLQAEAEKESATLKRAAVEAERDLTLRDKRVAEVEELLAKERFKVQRIEEEKGVLAKKVQRAAALERGHSHAASELEALQEELKEYKATLKCSVCQDRRKEVAITKCFHLFCSPCIQRNLELRHRKCPGCGVPFGQGDVKQIYL